MASALLQGLIERDAAALAGRVGDDVVFNSPVATYRGRADVVHLLTTIGLVLDEVRCERELAGPGELVSFVRARAAGGELDGVLAERHDDEGRAREITLLLRPLEALLPAIKRMGEALAAAPLPSQAGDAGD